MTIDLDKLEAEARKCCDGLGGGRCRHCNGALALVARVRELENGSAERDAFDLAKTAVKHVDDQQAFVTKLIEAARNVCRVSLHDRGVELTTYINRLEQVLNGMVEEKKGN